MKKILLSILIAFGGAAFSQSYPNYYPTTEYGNEYYSSTDEQRYFPEDYYYEYPSDYYNRDLYRSYYNDYQASIRNVNWNRFFSEYRLAPWQIQEILYLNQRFASYGSWNSYYHMNPDRWYYDRFYALQQILGPQVYVVFQNVYYGGYSPVDYYRDYRIRHYRPLVYVMPRYRNVNINIFRVDRNQYHQNNGWNYRSGQNGGFRDEYQMNGNRNNTRSNNGFRNDNSGMRSESARDRENAWSNRSSNSGSSSGMRSSAPTQPNSGSNEGFRSNERSAPRRSDEGRGGRQDESRPTQDFRPSQNNGRSSVTKLVAD